MKVLEKTYFEVYDWLNFENLSDSQGYKFELYSKFELSVTEFTLLFYSLFKRFIDDLFIGQLIPDTNWGDFCIDTWDLLNDRYNYSPVGKSKSTSAYLSMLIENHIEPDYRGFCKSLNWDKFLPIILNCILSHTTSYGIMVYAPSYGFVFYFHHTGSFGVYYKELNDGVKHIIERAKIEDLEIENTNDERLVSSIVGQIDLK